jgi:hypothetical protein
VAETLVTNFFCCFRVLRELYVDQGHNFEFCLMQEILQRLEVSKKLPRPLHSQSDGIVERYNKTVQDHLRRVVASHQRDRDTRLLIFLLAYKAYGLHPSYPSVRTALRHAVWAPPPYKERCTIDHAANLVSHLHDIHNYGRQHLKLASDRMNFR